MFDVSIKDTFPRRLACLKHEGEAEEIAATFRAAGKAISDQDLWQVCGMMVAAYGEDAPVTPETPQSCAGWLLMDTVDVDDPLGVEVLPGGRYAVLRHVGPYENLNDAYDYLYGEWLFESGESLRNGPTFEMYLNRPEQVAPEELITMIYVPLAVE